MKHKGAMFFFSYFFVNLQSFLQNIYILSAIENASSILDVHILCDTDHGSPRGMPHPLQFI